MKCELCGKPALALVRTRGKKPSRAARAGKPRKLKDHSLCAKCWEAAGDSYRVQAALQTLAKPALDLMKSVHEFEQEEYDRLLGIIDTARAALEANDTSKALDVLRGAA